MDTCCSITTEVTMIITNIKQALLNHFNSDNRVSPPIKLTDVNFLTPEVLIQGDCNTKVTFQATSNSDNWGGTKTIYYNRRRIQDDLQNVKIPGKPGDYKTLYQVLKVLREKLGVPVYDVEFLDKSISGSTVTIEVNFSSMAYLPNSIVTLPYVG